MSVSSETPPSRALPHLPGEAGLWVFILGDMAIFGLLFGTYLFYRSGSTDLYRQSQALLDRNLGVANTFLLLTSSWFVAMAVQLAKQRRSRPVPMLLAAAILCSLGFVTIKIVEYHAKIAAGITLATNEFFMFYFVLTGLHLFHLILGTGFLGYLVMRSRHAAWQQKDVTVLEIGATFWHLVDLLWIVLFPLLYLVR